MYSSAMAACSRFLMRAISAGTAAMLSMLSKGSATTSISGSVLDSTGRC
ncbi:hypothetical protein Y695_04325 [Hydrogenophaga sp. T4]|nr:hypothetical protein Y695_04325 [Hydrogenophaga sp. T4]